jgi:putative phosphoribosyl transferase
MTANEIEIPVKAVRLNGELEFPANPAGLVIFAHGSGSSRHSPRNQYVARILREAEMGTLLFDLLSAEEEQADSRNYHLRFNIPFLADRLIEATRWILDRSLNRGMNVGYFGSSTGSAAALVGAANLSDSIRSIVSRGGRPDLAGDALERVHAPTLLIVGGEDQPVIGLNEEAVQRLACEKALRIVPGASHLFEEPGALEKVAGLASEWFAHCFGAVPNHRS